MAKVMKIFHTLRNHWKKTTVGTCLLAWGGNWLYGKHCDNLLRRAACQEAQVFGNQIIPSNVNIKKATVFLNPAACKGKARSLFEKNAAPILHLSGLDVTVVKTDYEGQAKKLLELMEHTDMIIIAGGDGTLQEVITGLLRRADENLTKKRQFNDSVEDLRRLLASTMVPAAQNYVACLRRHKIIFQQQSFSKIPIGFIPLGKTSTLSHTLYHESANQVQCITDATLSILRGETIPLDVLQIKGNKDQPVFAVTGLRWGSYRDAGAKVSKYWYLGPLKIKGAHFFNALKEWPQKHLASLTYLGPTPRPPEEPEQKTSRPPLYIRLYKRLANYWAPVPKEIPTEATSESWQEVQLSAIEFSVTTQNRNLDLKRTEDFMNICIEPDTISKGDYIKRGSQKIQDPHLCPEGGQCLQASRCILQLPENTEGSLAIDNEEYEAMSVEVKLLPRKLQFFCDAVKKEHMLQGAS
ncbi:acylglycerol kinase, mitochondrial isoform X2 [Varanus komodoensis]|uniref:acylglycerol kinase, mitochondrial isoform X2 n=1 Tax=Varanus komodoensis TaxID=61221 RepID=UPI001CF7CF0D|nr:acylglycerol kinase, mitochondrial isoform X2 [Varanus komodoensis]